MPIWILLVGAGLLGLLIGFLGTVMLFLVMLAQNGLAMKDGKIRPIQFTPSNLVVNFPEGMTEERAQEMLIEFAARIRGESEEMIAQMLEERIVRKIERATRGL